MRVLLCFVLVACSGGKTQLSGLDNLDGVDGDGGNTGGSGNKPEDFALPTLAWATQPAPLLKGGAPYYAQFTVSAAAGVKSLAWDGGALALDATTLNGIAPMLDGPLTITVTVTDIFDRSASLTSDPFTIDSTPPGIDVIAPTGLAAAGAPLVVNYSASDPAVVQAGAGATGSRRQARCRTPTSPIIACASSPPTRRAGPRSRPSNTSPSTRRRP